ncbi:MAG TPA: TIR domain-containing protein [Thermoanaerobaculia bacterium]|nr:TIR domain-containing protein [Thermoanaerobaculia bacterium]
MPPFQWEKLVGLIAERKVVPVIGQDLLQVATPRGEMPLYRWLAIRAAEQMGLAPPADDAPNPLHAVAMQCRDKPDYDIYATIKSILETESFAPPQALVDLASIDAFSLFVTTTFDPLLEQALKGMGRLSRVYAVNASRARDLPDASYDSGAATVFHLFGQVSNAGDYAVTEDDTLELMVRLQSDATRPQNLFRELVQRDLLFLGNRFPDWLARFFIRSTKRERIWIPAEHMRFVADDCLRDDSDQLAFLRPHIRVYTDGTLASFVSELRRRWDERKALMKAKEATTSASVFEVERGSVFVSYAREDRPAAEKVVKALADAGLDVWFDQSDLHSGDDFARRIEEAIDRCAVFVPLISRSCYDSRRFFFREWYAGISVSKAASEMSRFLMPIVIDDIQLTDEHIPREFRDVHLTTAGEDGPPRKWVDDVREEVRKFRNPSRAGAA